MRLVAIDNSGDLRELPAYNSVYSVDPNTAPILPHGQDIPDASKFYKALADRNGLDPDTFTYKNVGTINNGTTGFAVTTKDGSSWTFDYDLGLNGHTPAQGGLTDCSSDLFAAIAGIKVAAGAFLRGAEAAGTEAKVVTQNHHWWPKELGGADRAGATVPIQSRGPNLHTGAGGIHPEMHSSFEEFFGTDTWKAAKQEFFKQDFQTQQSMLRKFYQTQGMNMPTMVAPGILK